MLIAGARVAVDAKASTRMNLWIQNGQISLLRIPSCESPTIDGEGLLALPGLINAHDHLELNLFPRLGHGPYPNATRWANDIYRPFEEPLKKHLSVPKPVRLIWGAVKNLLSGVTTVCHHNALHPIFSHPGFPIKVVKHFGWAHSLSFSPDWEMKFRATLPGYPFVMHVAEGTDESARNEIRCMIEAGALGPSVVLVHAAAAGVSEIRLLERAGASIVWCPSSNHFMLGKSLDQTVLNSKVPIALGTDSAITGDGDLLDELRFAQQFACAERLYSMVTTRAAQILKLPGGYGSISHAGPADLLLFRDNGSAPAEALLKQHPELVIVAGRIVLASTEFARRKAVAGISFLKPLDVEGRGQYLCPAHVQLLFPQTRRALGEQPRLAGKAIAA